ncbi:MAG: hypothetical protein QM767_12570 [Anaeromyxobacter sp.]
MRWLLVLALINGLAPDLAEAVEAVVHVAVEGHLPHTAGDPCDDGQGPEHGCGPVWHHCACCTNLAMASSAVVLPLVEAPPAAHGLTPVTEPDPDGAASRPFRPPIA